MGRNSIDIRGAHFEPHVNLKGFLHKTVLGLMDPAGEGHYALSKRRCLSVHTALRPGRLALSSTPL